MLEICKMLLPYPECNRILAQLGASSTSVGANCEEADGSITKEFNLAVSTVLNFEFGIYFELWILFANCVLIQIPIIYQPVAKSIYWLE